MNCKEIENNLIFYIEASLRKDKMADIKKHIDSCDKCTALHQKMATAFSFVEQDRISEANPFFYSHLTERLEENKQKRSSVVKLKSRELYLQAISYAAAIAVAIVLGIGLGKSTDLNNDIALEPKNELSEYQMFADSYNMNQPTEDTYEIELNEYEEAQSDINK